VMHVRTALLSSLLLAVPAFAAPPADPRAAIDCHSCDEWNAPQAPFKLHGRSWYVGPRGLAVALLQTDDGLALFDGALPQSAALVEQNLAALGFRLDDVRWIFVSHAHFDHVGGVAALQQATGATVITTPAAASALRAGDVPADDPQAAFGDAMRFPPVSGPIVELADGAKIDVGGVAVTAHHTPGHTPGGSSWSWRACEADHCVTAVYADSLNPVSAKGFRFDAEPSRVQAFERGIEGLRALDCELLVGVHPGFTGLFDALARRDAGEAETLLDPQACHAYADAASARLRQRLADEAAADESGS